VHLAGAALWVVGGAALLLRLLLHMYLPAADRNTLVKLYGSGRKRAAGVARSQRIQVASIVTCFLLLLALTGVLLPGLYAGSAAYGSEHAAQSFDVSVLVGCCLLWCALYLPSVYHAYRLVGEQARVRRAAQAGSASSPGASPTAAAAQKRRSTIAEGQSTIISSSGSSGAEKSGELLEMHASEDGSSALSLAAVLHDPVLLLHFRRFAEARFDGEALYFLCACQAFFRQLRRDTWNLSQLLEALQAICDEYVSAGAKQEVNLSQSLRVNTLAAVQNLRLLAVSSARERLKPASAELKATACACLQGAVKEVYQLVHFNSYSRFLASASVLTRAQRLVSWAEEFDEVDEEERHALLARLEGQQIEINRRAAAEQSTEGSGHSAHALKQRYGVREMQLLQPEQATESAVPQRAALIVRIATTEPPTSLPLSGSPSTVEHLRPIPADESEQLYLPGQLSS